MMKPYISQIVTFVTFLLVLGSCYYDNEEALYPQLSTGCDTANVTFSNTITTILSNNCYSCHSNATAAVAGNNIRLENYADVKANLSAVIGSVNHSASFSPMPKNGGKLNSCTLSQLDKWNLSGAPNN